ncbi:MAG: hypothetical protein IT438_04775 [Phycisphaerales bacterium]|nr:hypothetical protein [Phycisphaerales bacterium]
MASIGGWRVWGRRAGMLISAALSVGAAVMLVFKLVTPQAIAALGTPELVGLLMLLAMPMAGVWARRRGAAEWEGKSAVLSPGPQLVGGPRAQPTARDAGALDDRRKAA